RAGSVDFIRSYSMLGRSMSIVYFISWYLVRTSCGFYWAQVDARLERVRCAEKSLRASMLEGGQPVRGVSKSARDGPRPLVSCELEYNSQRSGGSAPAGEAER